MTGSDIMETEFSKGLFLRVAMLAAAGAKGQKIPFEDIDGHERFAIARLAMRQGVLPIVGCALLMEDEEVKQNTVCASIIDHTRAIAAQNQVKQQRIMWLIRELEHAGINVQLIKGYAVAECYNKPECRQSEDTDLLIRPEQERLAYEVLRKLGFRVDRRTATSHHAICQNPKYGMVELHVQLYDKLICDGWFHGISEELLNEPAIRIKNVHGEYTTLNYSDHAIFLTIHMVKHFIGVGINLRMMLDVALYISTHRTQINFERFWCIMQQLHFDCVANCVLTVMVRTGCFDWSEFPGGKVSSDDELAVFFDDLIATASDSWDSRKDSAYYEYSKAVMHQSMGHPKYCAYMIKWIFLNAKSQIWPAKEQLYALYGVEKPRPCLIPWLRLRRIVDLPMQKIWAGITPKRLLAKQQESEEDSRLHLFKKLKMI